MKAYQERASLRGLARVFGVDRQSISKWIVEHVKSLPDFQKTVLPTQTQAILEFDELWSFVLKKVNKRWLWTALCRRTCTCYSDFWEAYQKVLPKETHLPVGKESGQTKWFIVDHNIAKSQQISLTS